MLLMKTRFNQPGQPEVQFTVEEEGLPRESIDHVVGMFEEIVRRGGSIAPGQHIQLGWSLVKAIDSQTGCLSLVEPDGVSIPLQFKDGLTDALRQMLLQLWHADSFQIPRESLELPSIQDAAIACARLSAGDDLVMSRSEPAGKHDSGWFIGCGDRAHDHHDPRELVRMSLYHAFTRQPKIAPWAGFPVGTTVRLAPGEHPQVFIGEHECTLVPESFLDQALHAPGRGHSHAS